jgi:hypothetical protein
MKNNKQTDKCFMWCTKRMLWEKRNACRIVCIIVYGAKVQKKDRQGKRRTETTIGDLPNLGSKANNLGMLKFVG